jgi:hypothetical protein
MAHWAICSALVLRSDFKRRDQPTCGKLLAIRFRITNAINAIPASNRAAVLGSGVSVNVTE